MPQKRDFNHIASHVWELPADYDARMQVPARIYASEKILETALQDRSVEQLTNVAMLPGIAKYAMAMPDIHQGYGFPIGGVAAFKRSDGIVSPGGVGYDINCGVRMLASRITEEEIHPHISDLVEVLFHNCPTGVGGKGAVKLNSRQLDEVLEQGAKWTLRHGYATPDDLHSTESEGCISGAGAEDVSERAKERGLPQLGSLGSGNHFLEIDVVREVYDPERASYLGLDEGSVIVQIHCGSRGLGHEVCGSFLRILQEKRQHFGFDLPDRELVAAPIDSPEGRSYLSAMAAAANYAFANRQVLVSTVRQSFEQVLAGKVPDWSLEQVYDVTHNIAKMEMHILKGKPTQLIVHRKGATRAFPPGAPELHAKYQSIGQPVLVPGSMGTPSYVLVGTQKGYEECFGSSCHGAGRAMSRRSAMKMMRGEKVQASLKHQGILVRSRSMRGVAEEAPHAYKDVDDVVNSMVSTGFVQRVVRVHPIAVIKG
jgi:tRNA-splicing ligase RtcB